MDKDRIIGALARGYCAKANSGKTLDSDLIESMADEVMLLDSDLWQSDVLQSMDAFLGDRLLHEETELQMGINRSQAYIIKKALEDQQCYRQLLKRDSVR